MKNKLTIIGILAAFIAIVSGGLALYIYTRNFGVDYKGRARLHYNWRYYSAACPKESYRYEGKLFSFSYPKFQKDNPLREGRWDIGADVFSSDQLFNIRWETSAPAPIKSELSAHLSYAGNELPPFTAEFMQWVILESDEKYLDSDRIYTKRFEKIAFKDGAAAVLMTLLGKVEEKYNRTFVVGFTKDGQVFVAQIRLRSNVTEAKYRKLAMNHIWQQAVPPDAEWDAKSACVLKRFLETFENAK